MKESCQPLILSWENEVSSGSFRSYASHRAVISSDFLRIHFWSFVHILCTFRYLELLCCWCSAIPSSSLPLFYRLFPGKRPVVSSWNSDSSQSITSVFHRYMILLLISYVLRILEKALRLSTVPFQFPSLHFRSSSGSWSIRVHDIRIAHHSVLGECLIHVASFRPYCRRLMVPWNFLWRLCKPFAFLLIIKASPMLPSISCAVSSRQTSPL